MLALACFGLASGARADEPPAAEAPMALEDVPEALRPWAAWALHGVEDAGCTWTGAARRCVWPGRLTLEVGAAEGRFELAVHADRERRVALPGDDARWPLDVTIDGRPAAVLDAGGTPEVRVAPGAHRVRGAFRWRQPPELLPIPERVALVGLRVDGEAVHRPRRNDEGALWIQRNASAEEETGHLGLEVHRRLHDGVPFQVETHVTVRASGAAREVVLGAATLPGATPIRVEAELPVRVEPDGTLVAQVHGGTFEIHVYGALATPPETLAMPAQEAPWPDSEIWVFAANETLRQVELEGAPSVDPARTSLPDAWRSLPAYVVRPGAELSFRVNRRGEATPPPNEVRLDRTMWLDLDGRGFTVRDRMNGQIRRGFRLNLEEGSLGRFAVDGEDQLITHVDDLDGVELRRARLNAVAEWRLEATGDVPAVAWSDDAEHARVTVNLPPGWALLATRGADEAPGTWVHRWNLWDLFFVLLVTVAVARLSNVGWAALTFVYLLFAYQLDDAPSFGLAWLLALGALGRVVTHRILGRLLRGTFYLSAAIVLAITVAFAAHQLRAALHPQVEGGGGFVGGFDDGETNAFGGDEGLAMEALAPAEAPSFDGLRSGRAAGALSANSTVDDYTTSRQAWQDPNAIVQTGPGVPRWDHTSYALEWSGPVQAGHRVQLVLARPWMTRSAKVLRVAMLLGLLFLLLRMRPPAPAADAPGEEGADDAPGGDGAAGGRGGDGGNTPETLREGHRRSNEPVAPEAPREPGETVRGKRSSLEPPAPSDEAEGTRALDGPGDDPGTTARGKRPSSLAPPVAETKPDAATAREDEGDARTSQASTDDESEARRPAVSADDENEGDARRPAVSADDEGGARTPKASADDEGGVARVWTRFALGGLTALLGLTMAVGARADTPDPALLGALRARLSAPPRCGAACVDTTAMNVRIDSDTVHVTLEVSADVPASVPLPGPLTSFAPSAVRLDGDEAVGLVRAEGDRLELRVPAGPHRVEMIGPVPPGDALTLGFADAPHRATVDAEGWQVEGLRANGTVADSMQLRRLVQRVREGEEAEQPSLPAWFVVERTLTVGVRWTRRTVVRRLTPIGTAEVLRIPLLEGESVTTADALVEDGQAVLSFARDTTELAFESVVRPRDALRFEAPEGTRWSERWHLDCTPIWRCEPRGLAPAVHLVGGSYRPWYAPYPGEALEVAFTRPAPSAGASTTIDAATLTLRPGVRLQRATLQVSLRSSSGEALTLSLPEDAEVSRFAIDGHEQPVELSDGQLRFAVTPGHHEAVVEWTAPAGLGVLFEGPEVAIGASVVNAEVVVELPNDRWLLFTTGPAWGPAILFWGYLLVVLLGATLLGRHGYAGVRTRDFVLLGLGISQIPVVPALIIIGWFYAVAHRERVTELSRTLFNLRQLAFLGLSGLAAIMLYWAVHQGLLLRPEMQVEGASSYASRLRWYVDRTGGEMPIVRVLSVPISVYRVLMLGWALWLASKLLGWIKRGAKAFVHGGAWQKKEEPVVSRERMGE